MIVIINHTFYKNNLDLRNDNEFCFRISYYPDVEEIPYDLKYIKLNVNNMYYTSEIIAIVTLPRVRTSFYQSIDIKNPHYMQEVKELCVNENFGNPLFTVHFLNKDFKNWRKKPTYNLSVNSKFLPDGQLIKGIRITNEPNKISKLILRFSTT